MPSTVVPFWKPSRLPWVSDSTPKNTLAIPASSNSRQSSSSLVESTRVKALMRRIFTFSRAISRSSALVSARRIATSLSWNMP
jgi:hypothetical protein